jgi:hypothetical protein
LHNEGIKKVQGRDNAGALESFQKSADLSKSECDYRGVVVSLLCVGQVLLALGRAREAREKIAEGLELANEELLVVIRTVAATAADVERS